MKADVTVIGGGPGGYVAAIRAAQKGAKTVLVEKKHLGGTCLNVGCIPTKALLGAVDIVDEIEKWRGSGLKLEEKPELNFPQIMKRKEMIVNKLVGGVASLLSQNNVEYFEGHGVLEDPRTVKVKMDDGNNEIINSDKIILATGSEPIELPSFSFSSQGILDSSQALSLAEIPESMLIIGGGVIGVEFASIFNGLGTDVTVLEIMDRLIPGEDKDASLSLSEELQKKGIDVINGARAESWNRKNDMLNVTYSKDSEKNDILVEKVLVAVGRKPVLSDVGLDKIGIEYTDKGVKVNSRLRTNQDNIYAVGDLIGNYQLAHVAFQEGMVAVDNALGADKEVNYEAVPRCIYTRPEVAAVGLTEDKAREKYGDKLKIGKFPYNFNGKALSEKEEKGFVKVMVEPEYKQLVGCVMTGSHATELINQANIALSLESTVETIDDIIFPHPTISEVLKEGVLDALDMAIHG